MVPPEDLAAVQAGRALHALRACTAGQDPQVRHLPGNRGGRQESDEAEGTPGGPQREPRRPDDRLIPLFRRSTEPSRWEAVVTGTITCSALPGFPVQPIGGDVAHRAAEAFRRIGRMPVTTCIRTTRPLPRPHHYYQAKEGRT